MAAVLVQHLRATNDVNGNPRRIWAAYMPDGTTYLMDEGYAGERVLMDVLTVEQWRGRRELPAVDITPACYRNLLRR